MGSEQVPAIGADAQHLPLKVTCVPPTSLLVAMIPTNHRLAFPNSPPYPFPRVQGMGGLWGMVKVIGGCVATNKLVGGIHVTIALSLRSVFGRPMAAQGT